MRDSHSDEHDIFIKDYAEEQSLREILIKRQRAEEKLSKIEKIIKRLRDEIKQHETEVNDKLEKEQKVIDKTIKEQEDFKRTKRNVEIGKVEKFLRQREEDYQSVKLVEMVATSQNLEIQIT